MSAQSDRGSNADFSDADLMELLKFNADDLTANRAGHLSLQQRAQLLYTDMGNDVTLLIIGGLAFIWLIKSAIERIAIDQLFVLLVVVVLCAVFSRKALKVVFDALLGDVKAVSGTLHTQIYTNNQQTFAGMMHTHYATGTIEGITFQMSVTAAHMLGEKDLRIFYTPRHLKAVSGEWITKETQET